MNFGMPKPGIVGIVHGNDHPRSLGQRKTMDYISGIGGCTVHSIRRIIVQVII